MKVGFVSDLDFRTDGRQLYVNPAAAPIESSGVEQVIYFGRALPSTCEATVVPGFAPNFEAVNLRTRKHGAVLDALVVAYCIGKHRNKCDTFVLILRNLRGFVSFWLLKLAGRHVGSCAINNVFIAPKSQGGFVRRLRMPYALVL